MKYIIKSTNILHNKKMYKEGDIIELSSEEGLKEFLSPLKEEFKNERSLKNGRRKQNS